MSQIPKSREIYRHFKGSLYQVLELAEHSETGEQLVIYQALYGDLKIYARPLQSFVEKLDKEKYPDAAQTFRFELQTGEAEAPETDAIEEEAPQTDTIKGEAPQKGAGNTLEETPEVPKEEKDDAGAPEYQLDAQVLEFLDADSYEEKLNILVGLRHRITDEMITTMAIACDVEVLEGSLEDRFLSLKNCLLTKEKYECERPR
ncbi:MAG: DUF1653 domain-containing protein [Lachnospiraceae bacterium]|nr:DUF1653 domain-containing protein [Lachnospiraceae bacterium]